MKKEYYDLLKKLLKFSNNFEITVQFWPKQTSVYIAKSGVDLNDFGGGTESTESVFKMAIEYLERINKLN